MRERLQDVLIKEMLQEAELAWEAWQERILALWIMTEILLLSLEKTRWVELQEQTGKMEPCRAVSILEM